MTAKANPPAKTSFWQRHWHIKHFLIGSCVLLVGFVVLLSALIGWGKYQDSRRQHKLQPFYSTSGLSQAGPMGQVVRSQPLGISVPHGSAMRILYRTQRANGSVTFASGMVFIPNNENSGLPRPVVAWAHGTVGMGDQCAPSRTANPTSNIGWVDDMLARGWVVTATDYAGLGTPGTEGYLVGGDEARDVLNSVRALKYMPSTQAGATFVVYGHSQGGHSAIFTAAQAADYAPDLHLAGTVAAAPAAELVSLMNSSSTNNLLGWVIGPEILESWPTAYPDLNPKEITTDQAYDNYKRIANQCILQAVLGGQARVKFNQQFFSTAVTNMPGWRAAAEEQTAPALKPSQPLLVAESTSDQVVAPSSTALYIQQSCQAGSNISSVWVANVSHQDIPDIVAPQVIAWIASRFAGAPLASGCEQALPVAPAAPPAI